jgi:hypothetical protein
MDNVQPERNLINQTEEIYIHTVVLLLPFDVTLVVAEVSLNKPNWTLNVDGRIR